MIMSEDRILIGMELTYQAIDFKITKTFNKTDLSLSSTWIQETISMLRTNQDIWMQGEITDYL